MHPYWGFSGFGGIGAGVGLGGLGGLVREVASLLTMLAVCLVCLDTVKRQIVCSLRMQKRWSMRFKRILVAIDESPFAAHAADVATDLAAQLGAELWKPWRLRGRVLEVRFRY